MVDGLFTSKLRYGIQLIGKVRMSKEDPAGADFKAIQLVYYKNEHITYSYELAFK